MNLVLLPAFSAQPHRHFQDTVKSLISKDHIQNYVSDNVILSQLESSNSLWGFERTKSGIRHWERIQKGDTALSMQIKNFFINAKLC